MNLFDSTADFVVKYIPVRCTFLINNLGLGSGRAAGPASPVFGYF
jgi:hypothetical protein